MDMVDPQPTLVELLVSHVLLPREVLPQIGINLTLCLLQNTLVPIMVGCRASMRGKGSPSRVPLIWQRALPLPTKAGWYAVLADPQMPVNSTLLDQAHNAIERKLFAICMSDLVQPASLRERPCPSGETQGKRI
jgi:hypothetical protein